MLIAAIKGHQAWSPRTLGEAARQWASWPLTSSSCCQTQELGDSPHHPSLLAAGWVAWPCSAAFPKGSSGITRPGKQFPSQLSPDLPEAMQEGLFILFKGFSYSSVGKESAYNAGVPQFDSWVGKIHWRRDRLPTPVFWPGEFRRLYSSWGRKESDTTERLSLHFHGVLRQPDLAPEKSVFLRKSGQEATVRTGHGTTDWFQIGEEVRQVCILSPCLFDLCRVHHVKCGVG